MRELQLVKYSLEERERKKNRPDLDQNVHVWCKQTGLCVGRHMSDNSR